MYFTSTRNYQFKFALIKLDALSNLVNLFDLLVGDKIMEFMSSSKRGVLKALIYILVNYSISDLNFHTV
jgi:hypothetical protein